MTTHKNIRASLRILTEISLTRIGWGVLGVLMVAALIVVGWLSLPEEPPTEPESMLPMPTRAVQVNAQTKAIELVPID